MKRWIMRGQGQQWTTFGAQSGAKAPDARRCSWPGSFPNTGGQYQHVVPAVNKRRPPGAALVPEMAKRHRKRHPGVVLIKPDEKRRIGWRARYVDPDSGRTVKVSLNPALRSADAREDWAARKSREIEKRKLQLEEGAPRATQTGFATALERYFEDHPNLRARTLELYRAAARKLTDWAAAAGVRTGDELVASKLVEFRASLVRAPKRVNVKGGARGEVRETKELRSASTINIELRSTRRILGYLRALGLLARLSADNLRDGLKRLPVDLEEAEHLKPDELQRLLNAALAHDAERFDATRAEHAGLRPPGMTPRHPAIAPLVAVTLLSGMRFGEVIGLDWKQVDLEASDHDGNVIGVIRLTATTKTRRARKVFLDVSPALRDLLAVLRPEGARGPVWGGFSRGAAKAAARRLASYGAPDGWSWQVLRSSCGTYLTNAPGIYGGSSAYRSAKQLGHSVAVAEKHYVDVLRVSREAKTLEAAMQIEPQLALLSDAARQRNLQQERSPHVAGKRLGAMGHTNDREAD
jgi:integrase